LEWDHLADLIAIPKTGLQDIFWAKTSGYVLAPSTGPFEFGLSVVGRSRLFIDGKLVVDNGIENEQTPGPSFYGERQCTQSKSLISSLTSSARRNRHHRGDWGASASHVVVDFLS
jgi:hypothetical protein